MIKLLKKALLSLARFMGGEVTDERTGKSLGRAFLLSVPGGIFMVGLPHAVRPVFLPESTTRYTKHRIGFATHELPDYPSLHPPSSRVVPERLLWAILVHEEAEKVEALHRYWNSLGYASESILFVHAGGRSEFEALRLSNKVFVEDKEIRTIFHPMEKQSYGGALREIAAWMGDREIEAIAMVEYDHLPLDGKWGNKLCDLLNKEEADLLCHHLTRVDGTNASHYLYHMSDPRFPNLWKSFSLREDKEICFDAVMTGSVWRRAALEAVAGRKEEIPVYLELYLPSLTHHLGFRVRCHGDQDRFVKVVPIDEPFSPKWRETGAWSLHQVKSLPILFQG